MNVTPNSFSDGNQLQSPDAVAARIHQFGHVDALDIGAESTAPMNAPISHEEEWARLAPFLPMLHGLNTSLSVDTYHPETIFNFVELWPSLKNKGQLIWNDVSGKFDDSVRDFLKEGEHFHYVYCHNRAPTRELTGKHMDFVGKNQGHLEEELLDFFGPHNMDRVIFDPCLGFSKTYEENWFILDHFPRLQALIKHDRWLLGFSRKSFLRKKFQAEKLEELDKLHVKEIEKLKAKIVNEVWIRTHRPELI